jgi:hypothetical protein
MSAADIDPVELVNIPLLCACCPEFACDSYTNREVLAVEVYGPNECLRVTSTRSFRANVALETALAFTVGNDFPQGDLLSESVETFPSTDCTGTPGTNTVSVAVMCNAFIDGFPDPPALVLRHFDGDIILDFAGRLSSPNVAIYDGMGYRVIFRIAAA